MFIKVSSILLLSFNFAATQSQSNLALKITKKIVGGERAPIHYPYQLSLQVYTKNTALFAKEYSHICGASIINEYFVVTAAHCIVNQDISKLSLLAGTSNLNEESKGSRHPVLACLHHPDYKELNTSDIAMCKVKIPFAYGPNVSKIDFDGTFVDGGVNCTLTGWGSVRMMRWLPIPFYSYFAYPNELQQANFETLTNEKCIEKGHSVDKTQLCTLSKFKLGACAGDSGGPLAADKKLVGIVSYGTTICALGVPDVYTRVSFFVDWIKSIIEFNSTAFPMSDIADFRIPEAFQ